ncbi:MAG: CopG family transcriptional regulator [Desulfobacteraceae bacterium]|nr:CopG family transcriptional regulator [Desulfobacteraceae bacterium]
MMPQVAIYIDETLSEKLDKVTKASGKSRSKWVADVITERLENEWPQGFFELAGSWEDEKTPDRIMAEIRKGSEQLQNREELT